MSEEAEMSEETWVTHATMVSQIDAAVATAWEACARIAEECTHLKKGFMCTEHQAIRTFTCRDVAQAIRNRNPVKTAMAAPTGPQATSPAPGPRLDTPDEPDRF